MDIIGLRMMPMSLLQERWPNHVILRSSIIYGPQSPVPVSRVLFLQFISSGLRQGKSATFFEDEFRCPIYVKDILKIVRQLINQQDTLQHRLFNMGGPERLSRLEMAYITAECWNLDRQYIIPALSASVKRGVTSPADISMDSSLLQQELKGVHFTRLQDALFDIAQSSTERQDGLDSTTERLGQ